jgi:hypothetical protein
LEPISGATMSKKPPVKTLSKILPVQRGYPEHLTGIGEYSAVSIDGISNSGAKAMTDQMSGMVRHILTAVGAVIVYMGYMDEGGMEMFVGSALTMFGFVWSWMSK